MYGMAMNIHPERQREQDDKEVETSAEPLEALASTPASALELGTIIDGRYELDAFLGEGGYGIVYRAKQLSTGQHVALKILRIDKLKADESHKNEIARFEREMQLIGKLNHPNIVKLIDFGNIDGKQLYTVIEYIDGINLSALLEQEGALRPCEAKYLMTQVLEALSAAHALGIVYRDLKPQNIMITSHGVRRGIKLLDFGISGLLEDARDQDYKNLTQDGKINGTPSYMAPEQLRSLPPTQQTDIYAWGLVFLEMLLGYQVVSDASYVEVLAKQISSDPIEIPEELAQQPLGEILAKAVAKPLNQRYGNVQEALIDLEDCIVPQAMVLPWTGQHAIKMIQESISVRQSRGRTPSDSISSVWSDSMRLDVIKEQPPEPTTEPKRKAPLLIALIALLVIAGIVGVIVSQGSKDEAPKDTPAVVTSALAPTTTPEPVKTPQQQDTTAPDAQTAPEQPPIAAPQAPKRELRLEVEPSDAEIRLDGKLIGKGSAEASWLQDDQAHTLEITAKGYQDHSVTILAKDELPTKLSLQREQRSWGRAKRSTTQSKSAEDTPAEKPAQKPDEVKPVKQPANTEWKVKNNDLENPWK